MFFIKSQIRLELYDRIVSKDLIAMMFCIRCVRNHKKCRFSILFRRCAKCVRVERKCEFFESIVNFNDIDKNMKKLKREKLKIEIV